MLLLVLANHNFKTLHFVNNPEGFIIYFLNIAVKTIGIYR